VATRADVARMAGVSPSVVSYVINKGPRPVSREAEARVAAAIEALDYRPNAIASALRGGSTKSIGLLMPSPVNPYFAELADAIERTLFEAGNLLSIGIIDDDAARERVHLRSLIDRRVDGIIMTSSRALGNLNEMHDDVPPVVVIDRTEESQHVSSVHAENVLDSAYAVEHLQGWGHRIIGCITGPRPIPVSAERMLGWSEQQAREGFPNGWHLVAHADFSTQGGAEAAHALLGPDGRAAAMPEGRPTALFVSSDAQAHGVLHACDELGLRVPEDLSIVSFDGTQSARFTRPPLTAMRQPIPEMGATAARILLDMVADPARPPRTEVFRSNLVLGGSCAPPPGA
jgi:LacI family transcriptional regulator